MSLQLLLRIALRRVDSGLTRLASADLNPEAVRLSRCRRGPACARSLPRRVHVALQATLALLLLGAFSSAALGFEGGYERYPTRYRLTGEPVALSDDEPMGLAGGHYDLVFGKALGGFAGLGGYGAVTGNRGGFFVVGASAGARLKLLGPVRIELGGFAGGGGGASAPQGGGLMLRPHLALELESRRFAFRAELAEVRFPNGAITSRHFALGVTLADELLLASSDLGSEPLYEGRRTRIGGMLSAMVPLPSARLRTGGPMRAPVFLAGAQLDRFVSEHWYVPLLTRGAFAGGVAGYMDVFSGIGYATPLSSLLELQAQLLAGAGGGGNVGTGGGFLAGPDLGLSLHLSPTLVGALQVGALVGDGRFSAVTGTVQLGWQAEGASTEAGEVPHDGWASETWEVVGASKFYLPGDARNRSGRTHETVIGLVGAGIDKPVLPWLALTGRGYGAFFGGVGGYAEGLIGAGATLPLAQVLSIYVALEGGAAGGGGVATGSGLIADAAVGLRLRMDPRLELSLDAGHVRALTDRFRAQSIGLALRWRIERVVVRP